MSAMSDVPQRSYARSSIVAAFLVVALAAMAVCIAAAGIFYATHFDFLRDCYFTPARAFWPALGSLFCSFVLVAGAWSSGILAFHSRHRVINIDGLCNIDVIPYVKAGKTEEYMRLRGITYIADHSKAPPGLPNANVLHRESCDSGLGDVICQPVPARRPTAH
jgi:hypothetical protein